jgi:hypothetical protein
MAVAQIIQRRLAAVGVTLSLLETHSSEEYFTILTTGRFDLALGGWIADTVVRPTITMRSSPRTQPATPITQTIPAGPTPRRT